MNWPVLSSEILLYVFHILLLTCANLPRSYYGDLGHAYPSGSDSAIIGLCTGLLPSAAVSCSKTVGELIPVAVETVVLALRLGLCVHSVRKLVDRGTSNSPSWSALVSGISEGEALDKIREFSSQKVSSAALLS